MRAATLLSIFGSVVLVAMPVMAADPVPPADNSGTNKTQKELTPLDQSNAEADVKVTADIRKAIVAVKDLSTYAHNVKIITTDKQIVHLRGVVSSDKEKATIGEIAKKNAGKYPVKNEVLVEPSKP